ncbi:MAG TPA: amylo-alpha-1,6-glucosidase [Chryseosolibacter sp.]
MHFSEFENKYYILATSSLADQRTMVLKQGDSFGIFDSLGDIHQIGAGTQGIYHNGTRFLSRLELNINGNRPLLLSAAPREDNQVLVVDLTNPDLILPDRSSSENLKQDTLHIQRLKFLWQAKYHEKIKLLNFGLQEMKFTMELQFQADYYDIFEVRGIVRENRGKKFPVKQEDGHLIFSYQGLDDVLRETNILLTPQPEFVDHKMAVYEITLQPKQQLEIEIEIAFTENHERIQSVPFEQARNALNMYMERTNQYCAGILTSNEEFNDWINRARSDLITMATPTPYGLYPYAGVPWFSTPFGRDGIITAMECLWVEPELAKGVLHYLAHTQAKSFNDFQDAEPGKIFHETRGGEMANLKEIPFKMYYGTIDATPLFISLAGAYLERTNDVATIQNIWEHIRKALYWIDHYGDIDGDGFLEYKTKSSKGLTNQGWKDSQDSVFHEDGSLAEDPIALCEVQAYVYDAKVRAAQIADVLGEHDMHEDLMAQARALKRNFNEHFWSESKQAYVLALDGKKRPCNVLSSNAGHCLFSGIATRERAAILAEKLLSEKMFSGWGIRTVASDEPRFNPMSYHNGSVWPHDNAMIAFGFSRYGLMAETVQILSGIFDATDHIQLRRLPELFCGFSKVKGKAPTLYPVACSPQAWAVGAVFMLLQACLGLKINAAHNTITFCHPVLPDFLSEVTITNLRINNKQIILQIRKSSKGIEAQLLSPGADAEIIMENKPILELA